MWYYIDDYGQRQGPFDATAIIAWRTQGLLRGNLLMQCAQWSDTQRFAELESLTDEELVSGKIATTEDAGDVGDTATTAATATDITAEHVRSLNSNSNSSPTESDPSHSQKSPDTVAAQSNRSIVVNQELQKSNQWRSEWYYIVSDLNNRSNDIEYGPYSSTQMRHWCLRGYFRLHGDNILIRTNRLELSLAQPLLKWHPWPIFAQSDVSIEREERWYYINDLNEEEGPWTTDCMREWWRNGLLSTSLLVKQIGETEFISIQDRPCSFCFPAPMK